MSKSVKTIVSVAAAIAIPFAAPAIASSIGLSAAIGGAVGSATAGSVIGGAVTGAALGAAKGAILGEDVGRSALMGGLGGGVGGYTTAPAAAASSVPQSAITAANATADPIAALNASQGFTGVDAGYLASIMPVDQIAVMNAQQGWTTPDQAYTAQAAQTPAAGLDTTGLSGAMPTPAAVPTTPITPAAGGAGAPAGAPKTFGEALSRAGAEVKAKFTDPKNLADLTLRAAGQLAGSALAGSGLSDEEQALLNAQTEELRMLQQTNQALFNQRLEQAQNLIGESRYFDPEYFGLQSARRAQVQGAIAKRAGLRGLTGERREAEARRYDIETGRRTGTAYDVGFGSAVQPRVQTQMAGLAAMPTGYPSSMGEYSNLRAAYEGAETRRQKEVGGLQRLFGTLTETPQASSRG